MLGKLWLKWHQVPWWVRWIAYGIAPIFLFYIVEDLRGWWAWKNYREKWEAHGDRFEIEHYELGPIADEENFAATPFIQELFQNEGDFVEPKKYWQLWRVPDYEPDQHAYRPLCRDFPFETLFEEGLFDRTEAIAKILHEIEASNSTIDELAAAAKRPSCDFPIDLKTEGWRTRGHHFGALITLSRNLVIRGLAHLNSGEPADAFSDIEVMFDLSRHATSEGLLISMLIDHNYNRRTLYVIWEGLRKRAWSDSELEQLQERLEGLDPSEKLAQCVLRERAVNLQEIDRLAASPLYRYLTFDVSDFQGMWSQPQFLIPDGPDWTDDIDIFLSSFYRIIAPRGWYWQNKVKICRRYEGSLAIRPWDPDFKAPEVLDSFDPAIDFALETPYNFLAQRGTDSFDRISREVLETETTIDLARTAIAAERYRNLHGDYPAAAADLVPEFLDGVPVDRFSKTGEPIRYQRRPGGTIAVYSVGLNGADDGGRPHYASNRGDTAWQYTLPPRFTAEDYRR